MASSAFNAQGSTLSIKVGAAPVPIKNIKSFSGFDGASAEIDVTNLDSLAKEFRLGLVDSGSFSAEIDRDFADPGQVALLAAQIAAEAAEFTLKFPTGDVATFTGFVKKLGLSGGVDAVVKGSIDIRISGAVTWAAKSGAPTSK